MFFFFLLVLVISTESPRLAKLFGLFLNRLWHFSSKYISSPRSPFTIEGLSARSKQILCGSASIHTFTVFLAFYV